MPANQDAVPQSPTEPLTPKQLRVARLVAEGLTDKLIAAELSISEHTVAYHVSQIVKRWELDVSLNVRVQITNKARAA